MLIAGVCRLHRDPSWSETGDRYMLKLFRDYMFHQVDENGAPWIDMAHIVSCMNKVSYRFLPPGVAVTTGVTQNRLTQPRDFDCVNQASFWLVGWLVVFYVPSTARSFRGGTTHLLSLAKDMKLGFYTVPTVESNPGLLRGKSITLPLRHASSPGFTM